MANTEQNRQEFEAKQKELEAKLAALENENAKLRGKRNAGKLIEGTFNAEWETPEGKKVKKKLGFIPGHVYVRIYNGEKVEAENLIKFAAGKLDLEKLETPDKAHLSHIGQDGAKEWLLHLAQIGYGGLEER